MYVLGRFLITSLLVLLFISAAIKKSSTHAESMTHLTSPQHLVALEPFSSVELRGGGKAILRHGPVQRVTLLKGSPNYTQVTIAGGDRLTIDKCRNRCPLGYELEVEIVSPDLAGISITDGGTIESRGSFPRRTEIRVAVSDGGTIDIRLMPVGAVTASVDQGGRILTKPQTSIIASIRHGGNITYWGDAQVKASVRDGGVVAKGSADDADKPLSEFGPSFLMVPPIPPVPVQPVRNLFP